MGILEFLGFKGAEPAGEGGEQAQAVRQIADSLDRMDPDKARYVAAFAYILCRVASADLEISREETDRMERVLVEIGQLEPTEAILVIQMAKTQNLLFGGTQNYIVTKEFERIATHEQKMALLECLFAVSAADDSISTAEDNVIRQIADELRLERSDVVRVRTMFREHLEVLKKPRTGGDGGS